MAPATNSKWRGGWVKCLIPAAERVKFTSSGTEATLTALRLARSYTRKRKGIKLEGHFHGWHDHVQYAFRIAMILNGVDLPAGTALTSAAHTEADIEATAEAFDNALGLLQTQCLV